MKKDELIRSFSVKADCTQTEAEFYLDTFLSIMKEELGEQKTVRLSSFGLLYLYTQVSRPARNPKNGIPCMIAPRVTVKFKPSPFLLDILNKD